MNKNYKVEIQEGGKYDTYLYITQNGYQWSSIVMKDVEAEIPVIIAELQQYLKSKQDEERK